MTVSIVYLLHFRQHRGRSASLHQLHPLLWQPQCHVDDPPAEHARPSLQSYLPGLHGHESPGAQVGSGRRQRRREKGDSEEGRGRGGLDCRLIIEWYVQVITTTDPVCIVLRACYHLILYVLIILMCMCNTRVRTMHYFSFCD